MYRAVLEIMHYVPCMMVVAPLSLMVYLSGDISPLCDGYILVSTVLSHV